MIPQSLHTQTYLKDAMTCPEVAASRWAAPAPGAPSSGFADDVPHLLCSNQPSNNLMFPGEEVIEHNLESCGGAELLAWMWGSQKVGFALVQGPDCESSPSTMRGWEHLFSEAMMYLSPSLGEKQSKDALTASLICMAGEVPMLELSEEILVTPYCL